jgi:hypothetical protein
LPNNPLREKQGVFVHLHEMDISFDDQQALGISNHGVIAYGVLSGEPFNLWERANEFRFGISTIAALHKLPQPFWVMPVRWVQARFEGQHVPEPNNFFLKWNEHESTVLEKVQNQGDVDFCKQALGMDPIECPF